MSEITELWSYDWEEEDGCTVEDMLEDLRMSLNIEVKSEIVGYAELGLWDGIHRHMFCTGYVNMRNLIGEAEYGTSYYLEGEDFKMKYAHHDGNNVYVFRIWKDGVTEEQKEELKENFDVIKFYELTDGLWQYVEKAYF